MSVIKDKRDGGRSLMSQLTNKNDELFSLFIEVGEKNKFEGQLKYLKLVIKCYASLNQNYLKG